MLSGSSVALFPKTATCETIIRLRRLQLETTYTIEDLKLHILKMK